VKPLSSPAQGALIRVSLTLASLLAFSLPAEASESEGRTLVIDERPEGDDASSSTLVGRDEMDDALSDLGEVLDRQPGIRITRLGGLGSYATASIRGSSAEQVLVLLDGIPLVSAEGGPLDLATLPLGLIRRITITRGTSPAAFGVSAIGGVMDIQLREPLGNLLELEVGGGSFDTRSARAFYGFGNGEEGAGFALDYQGSQGDFPYTHGGGTAWDESDGQETYRDYNAFDRFSGLARGRLLIGDQVSIRLLDLISWRKREVPGIAIHEGGWATLETLRNTLGSEVKLRLNWADGASIKLLPWLTWSSSELSASEGGLSLGSSSSKASSLSWGTRANLRVPIKLDSEGQWILESNATLAYRHEGYQGEGVVDQPTDARRERLAASAELGLRSEAINTTLIVNGRSETSWTEQEGQPSLESTELSARVGLLHEAWPGTSLHMNLSQGARFPTPFELFGYTAMTRGNASLRPERGLTWDGGIKHQALWLPQASYASIELSAFASWSDDLIQFVRNSQGVSRPENVASALIAGVEFGMWCDLFNHLRLRTSLTWNHSEDRSDIAARKGKKLPYRPTWKTYGRAEAYLYLPGAGESGLALEVEHLEGDVLDHANLIKNPSRIIFGLAAWIELLESQIRLGLNIRNVADAKVLDFQGYPLPGPSVMATLKWQPLLD